MKFPTAPAEGQSECEANKTISYHDKKFLEIFDDVNIRFIKVKFRAKEALEKCWQIRKNYGFHSSEIREWIKNGGNYGLTSPTGFACFVDADTREIQNVLESSLPETLRWSTGREEHYQYAYSIADEPVGCIPMKDGAYVKGKGGYALGPGSVHPNGTIYGSREVRDVPIAIVNKTDLINTLKKFMMSDPENSKGFQFSPLSKGPAKINKEEVVKILLPYWVKANGRRNELTLSIAGFIAHSGGSEDDALFVISNLCERTRKGHDHILGARYAFHRDGPVKGFRSLEQLMEEIEHD
jgi:hypothetical protein